MVSRLKQMKSVKFDYVEVMACPGPSFSSNFILVLGFNPQVPESALDFHRMEKRSAVLAWVISNKESQFYYSKLKNGD